MIPKVIHYCWFGGKPLPADVKACIRSWKKHCPDYEIRRWDESNFDVNAHPFMKAAYEAKAWAFVSDYARLQVVYENGGIYLDTDVELKKSLDAFLEHPCYLAVQQADAQVATGLGFGAQKGNTVIGKMLRSYDDIPFDPENRDAMACPLLNTKMLAQMGYVPGPSVQTVEDAVIYPPRYFDPVAPGHQDITCPDTVSVHHYSATWVTGLRYWKRKLARWIGDKWIIRLKGLLK